MGLRGNLNQKIDNLQYSITKINKLLEIHERGRFPSQTVPNPKGIHEVGSSNNSGMDEVKAIITLEMEKRLISHAKRLLKNPGREKNCSLSIFS